MVDITEAAASTAQFLGHRYSVVTTLDRAVPLIEDRLRLAGLLQRCASVRASGLAVLELESDPERAVEAIAEQAGLAVREDHAEVICLGCGGMAGLTEAVAERTGSTGRRRRRRGRDHRRGTRPPRPDHLPGPHVRPTPAQDDRRLASRPP